MCRRIARWVATCAATSCHGLTITERPIGADPDALRQLNPGLDIWDAYATVHVLMPDGSMKLGGEAVAEVLRDLPNTRWFAGLFGVRMFGFRPFQAMLNAAYTILADMRPLFGSASCGRSSLMTLIEEALRKAHALITGSRRIRSAHFSPRSGTRRTMKLDE